jgi:hypothetical protein
VTDKVAIGLAAVILTLAVGDVLAFGSDHLLFLGTKFVDFIDYLAFWR